MNLSEMHTRVRRDLKDEDAGNYRWTNDEIDRHIDHALRDFSKALPREMKTELATTAGSREIDISSLTDRVLVLAVEYPVDNFPPYYQRFALYQDTLTLLGSEVPDGSNARIFYGKLHTLNADTSTIPSQHEDIVAVGAEAYALIEWAAYSINRVSLGGEATPQQFRVRGEELLRYFKRELARLKSRLRTSQLYQPATTPASSKSLVDRITDWGP
jgi:hypothetical protein